MPSQVGIPPRGGRRRRRGSQTSLDTLTPDPPLWGLDGWRGPGVSETRGAPQCLPRVIGILRLAGTWSSIRQRNWQWGEPGFVLTRADEERVWGGLRVEKAWLMHCQRGGRASQPCGAGRDNACPLSMAPTGVQSPGLLLLALIWRPPPPALQPSKVNSCCSPS